MVVCQNCGAKNKAKEAETCISCFAPLTLICPACQTSNTPINRFCQHCAVPLSGHAVYVDTLIGQDAERRQLTIMFCDLVGSTALSEHLDPEELREIVQAYQEVCADGIGSMEGYIAQFLGDGILAYFGYPRSHEDEPLRAIKAGRRILAGVTRLNETLQAEKGLEIAVRIGIHTGMTVIGDIGAGAKRERLALGETPNIAARIEGLAEANQIAVSASTYKLAQKHFAFEHTGTYPLKGISQPMAVYRPLTEKSEVVGEGQEHEAWFFVGRRAEYTHLKGVLELAKQGTEVLVLIEGSAGIGKSHLLEALIRSEEGQEIHLLATRCSRHYTTESFYPIADLFRRSLDLIGATQTGTRLERMEKYLSAFGFPLEETVPLFAQAFHVPMGDAYRPPSLSAKRIRQRIFAMMREIADKMAAQRPLLFIVEDLQWADPDTLDLLRDLWENRKDSRILFLFTCRPEFTHDWPGQPVQHISLRRLPSTDIISLASQLVAGKQLPEELIHQLVKKADGNPLFLAEIMRDILEAGLLKELPDHFELVGSLDDIAIPASLKDLLSSRLDQLGAAREIAQLAAVFGRQFPVDVIQAVSGLERGMINASLLRLIEAGLLNQQGKDPESIFAFKHTLVQEEAYELLLRRKRQEYHLRIAEVLEKEFARFAGENPAFIAYHYTVAGAFEQAIPNWLKAGAVALRSSAYAEAISYLEKGLALLEQVPVSAQRDAWELNLQASLGPALLATRGYAGPVVAAAYGRAYELARQSDEYPQLAGVLRGLWSHSTVKGDHQQAAEIAGKLARIAIGTSDPLLAFEAAKAVGGTEMWRGNFDSARKILEHALRHVDLQKRLGHAHVYAEHPVVGCLAYLGYAQLLMGQPQLGLESQQKACDFAALHKHPFSQAYSLSFKALGHLFLRDLPEAESLARRALELADKHDFSFWRLFNRVLISVCEYDHAPDTGNRARFQDSIDAFRQLGAELWISHPLTLLAAGMGKQGQMDKAMALLEAVADRIDREEERFYEAETLRVKGELLMRMGEHAQALEAFRKAVACAEKQQSVLFELRARAGWAICLDAQGKSIADARLSACWAPHKAQLINTLTGKEIHDLLSKWTN